MAWKFFIIPISALVLALCGCATPQTSAADSSSQKLGPTGLVADPVVETRESYLIPPEIPTSLLTYIFQRDLDDEKRGEIIAISISDQSENMWALNILRESPPDGISERVHRYIPTGTSWREL
jgi:hypothetical protein